MQLIVFYRSSTVKEIRTIIIKYGSTFSGWLPEKFAL